MSKYKWISGLRPNDLGKKRMRPPEHVLKAIRQRLDLSENDDSRDDLIELLTPMSKLRAVCSWHLGSETWADEFIKWARDCGMAIDTGEDSE